MSAAVASPGATSRSAGIDACRGFAALAVLCFHSFGAMGAVSVHPLYAPLRWLSSWGWFGVELFFVISGYCISQSLSAALRSGRGAPRFWLNRALRIFPTYWAALLLTLALNLASLPFNHGSTTAVVPHSIRSFAADLLLLQPYAHTGSVVLVSWSLVFEIGFYAVAGLVLLAARKGAALERRCWFGFVLCAWPLLSLHVAAFHVLSLWPDFFLGVAAFHAECGLRTRDRARTIRWLAVIAIIGATALALPALYGGETRAATAVFAALLVLLVRVEAAGLAVPGSHWLAGIGGFSYSLYLVHVPLVSRVIHLGLRFVPADSLGLGPLWLAAVGASLAGAWIFYQLVEVRCERLRRRVIG